MTVRVAVDPANPGQFFACCGLLELADRLWDGAEGWFAAGEFRITASQSDATLADLFTRVQQAGLNGALTPELRQERDRLEEKKRKLKKERKELPKDEEARRKELGTMYREGNIILGEPFNLLLDWWQSDDDANPKTWAGSQAVIRIAKAALSASREAVAAPKPFDHPCVMRPVPDGDDTSDDEGGGGGKKVEPFYFDARRGANALALDIGFMPDALQITASAYPAVEFFCLVGLQRCRPRPTDTPRVFDYFTWSVPCGPPVLPLAVCGLLGDPQARGYRFENAFRTGQKKHKAFNPATPLGGAR
jgi:CRISPR-associated protein Csb3